MIVYLHLCRKHPVLAVFSLVDHSKTRNLPKNCSRKKLKQVEQINSGTTISDAFTPISEAMYSSTSFSCLKLENHK